MKLNRKWILVMSLVLSVAMATTGTLAYLTDSDATVNVMTLGKVSIEQHEYERKVNADGSYETGTVDDQNSYVLKDFSQGKPLVPTTEIDADGNPVNFGAGDYDDTTVRMSQVASYGGMQVFESENAQDKFVTVENTGRTDAYVRTIVALEAGSVSAEEWGNLIRTSHHFTWDDPAEKGIVNIDGNNYMIVEFVYKGWEQNRHVGGVLPAGETTYPNLSQVYMTAKATNEDVEKLDGNNNGLYDIMVLSQAVQADGFDDAATALKAGFGEVNAANVQKWFGGMGNAEYVDAPAEKYAMEGDEAAEVLAALSNGTNLIVDEDMDIIAFDTNAVDAKGATVTLAGQGPAAYGYLAFMPDAGEDVIVENLNVTGSGFVEAGHYGQGGGNYTLNNVKIENLGTTLASGDKGYTLGCAFMGYGTTTLNNCVMTGATSVRDDEPEVIPVDLGCGNNQTTNIMGGEYGTVYCWSHATVNLEDADVDTMYVAPIKGSVTIKAGSHINTIKVDYGTASNFATNTNLAKLVIEQGATVNAIVFNNQNYSLEQWNNRGN